jgi:hypothetical protein
MIPLRRNLFRLLTTRANAARGALGLKPVHKNTLVPFHLTGTAELLLMRLPQKQLLQAKVTVTARMSNCFDSGVCLCDAGSV